MGFDEFGLHFVKTVTTAVLITKKIQRLMHEMNIQDAGYRKKRAKYNSYPGPDSQTTRNRFRRRLPMH